LQKLQLPPSWHCTRLLAYTCAAALSATIAYWLDYEQSFSQVFWQCNVRPLAGLRTVLLPSILGVQRAPIGCCTPLTSCSARAALFRNRARRVVTGTCQHVLLACRMRVATECGTWLSLRIHRRRSAGGAAASKGDASASLAHESAVVGR